MRFLASLFLRVTRWSVEGSVPSHGKFVMIAAPHTSNWDLPYMLAVAAMLGAKVSWMGKEQIFTRPFAGVMRWLGGIPVRRDAPQNLVEQMIGVFAESDDLILVVPPEGTRSEAEYWHSGFYHIAVGAGVPVIPGFLDWERRVGGVGDPIELTGDVHEDMDRMRAFYGPLRGKRPDKQGPIALRAEDGG